MTVRLYRRDAGGAAAAGARPGETFYVHLGHADGSEDMDGLFAKYRAAGVKVTMPPTVQPWGLREFEVEEPNGYRFTFAVDARPYVER